MRIYTIELSPLLIVIFVILVLFYIRQIHYAHTTLWTSDQDAPAQRIQIRIRNSQFEGVQSMILGIMIDVQRSYKEIKRLVSQTSRCIV